jgi:hypothetical protein
MLYVDIIIAAHQRAVQHFTGIGCLMQGRGESFALLVVEALCNVHTYGATCMTYYNRPIGYT